MQLSKYTLAVLLVCFTFSAQATGLLESYSLAQNKDPRLKLAYSKLAASKQDLEMAKSGYFPKVQMALNHGRGSTDADTGFLASSGQRSYQVKNYALTLKQPLINFSLSPQKSIANENIAVSEIDVTYEKLSLFSRVSEKYFEVLYAGDLKKTLEQKMASYEKQQTQSEKRLLAGVGLKSDVIDTQAEMALTNAQLIEAQVRLNTSKKNFESLVGISAEKLKGLDYKQLKTLALDKRSLEQWVESAISHNPELEKAEREINLSSYKYQRDKYYDYPTLDFLLSQSKTENDSNITIGSKFDTTSGLLQLNIPLFTGGYATALENQSALQIDAARHSKEVKALEVYEKITALHQQLQNASGLISAYAVAIDSYELSLKGANKAYIAGVRTLSDILKLRDKVSDTQLSLSKSCYTYLLSYIQLRELTGEVNQDDYVLIDSLMKESMHAFAADGSVSIQDDESAVKRPL